MDHAEATNHRTHVVSVDGHDRIVEVGGDAGHAPAGSGLTSSGAR